MAINIEIPSKPADGREIKDLNASTFRVFVNFINQSLECFTRARNWISNRGS